MKWRTSKVVPAYAGTTASLEQKRDIWVKRFSKNLWGKVVRGVKRKETYVEMICAVLIILFIYTGLNKIIDHNNFNFQLGRSPFTEYMKDFLAYAIPIGEIIISILLLLRKTRFIGLLLSLALMLLFTGYIWLMLNYSPDLPCSCGGIISAMSWNDHLIFNSIVALLTLAGAILQHKINPTTLSIHTFLKGKYK